MLRALRGLDSHQSFSDMDVPGENSYGEQWANGALRAESTRHQEEAEVLRLRMPLPKFKLPSFLSSDGSTTHLVADSQDQDISDTVSRNVPSNSTNRERHAAESPKAAEQSSFCPSSLTHSPHPRGGGKKASSLQSAVQGMAQTSPCSTAQRRTHCQASASSTPGWSICTGEGQKRAHSSIPSSQR